MRSTIAMFVAQRLASVASALTLASCSAPTARIEPMIAEFKRRYPERVIVHQGPHRKIGAAWSGDIAKRPVLFVHGSPGSWEGWAEFLLDDALARRFHLIAIDRPGFGASDGGRAEPSLRLQAEDALAVLSLNKSALSPILVGHSYGGAVIAEAATQSSPKIAGLVFVASSVDPSMEDTKWYQVVASWWPFRSVIPTDLRVCNEEIMALESELRALSEKWSAIHAQVATVQGDADPLVPAGNQDFITVRIRPERLVLRIREPGMNHFVPWEHPELVRRALIRVADTLDAGVHP